jgi:hypothetical protein
MSHPALELPQQAVIEVTDTLSAASLSVIHIPPANPNQQWAVGGVGLI